MKELTFLQIENGKNNLIKQKNDLIERFKKNDRRKKADKEYYDYEKNKFHGLKNVRNLFNQTDNDDNYEGFEYLFYEGDVKELIESCELIEDKDETNDLIDYLEIIFNKTVEISFNESPFKSLISDIRSILPKDGCKKLKKRLKYIRELRKSTTLEIKNIKNELIKIKNKRINRNKKKVRDYYQENKFYGVKDIRNLFDDDDDEDIYEGIEYLFDEKIMYYYFKQKDDKIIKLQKVEDIKMPQSSKNESDKIKELGLTMEELKSIARKIDIKNYENPSRIELVKEIDKLEPSKESKKKKITSSLLLKGKQN